MYDRVNISKYVNVILCGNTLKKENFVPTNHSINYNTDICFHKLLVSWEYKNNLATRSLKENIHFMVED